jgi:hypothetical protein
MNRFEEALEWFNKANWDERVPEIQAIRDALRIASSIEALRKLDDQEPGSFPQSQS